MKTVGELAPTLFADRQARSGVTPPWANGKNGKEYRATMGTKPIGGIFSVGVEEAYRWKDSVQSARRNPPVGARRHRQRPAPLVHQVLRHAARPALAEPVEDLYGWHYRNERYLRNEEPLARVAMVYSQQTAQFYGGERARRRWRTTRWATTRR